MINEKGQFIKHTIPWNKGTKGITKAWNKGKKCPEISLRQMGDKNPAFGKPSWNKGTKGVMKPNKTSFKKGQIGTRLGKKLSKLQIETLRKSHLGIPSWNKGIKQLQTTGDKNPNWKGGITPENNKIRSSLEMKLWKKSCFERDNFTCQKTGDWGGELVVHHINNFADFPELRTSIANGITLNKKVHKEFHHIYGNKNNTKSQLEEFLINK